MALIKHLECNPTSNVVCTLPHARKGGGFPLSSPGTGKKKEEQVCTGSAGFHARFLHGGVSEGASGGVI